MRTQRVLKVTKSRSMVNIKQYMYSQYRHTLTKIDARASKNLPPPQLSHSLWHVLRSRLALWHIIGTLLLWRIGILPLGHIGTLAPSTLFASNSKTKRSILNKRRYFCFSCCHFIVSIINHNPILIYFWFVCFI